jgi:hypothetical protein
VKAFNAAWLKAHDRLATKPNCLDFFGQTAIAAFSATLYSFQALGAPTVDQNGKVQVTGAATFRGEDGGPSTVFINTQGPFLNQTMFVPGKGMTTLDFGTGLRGADFGALILLHELGHVVGKFGPDAKNPDLNRQYTQDVLKNCF